MCDIRLSLKELVGETIPLQRSWQLRHVDERDRLKGGYIIGVANDALLEQAESPVSVISWHSGKLTRVVRSSNSAELQAVADAEGELSYIHVGETIPLQCWQEAAAQVPGALVLDSRGVYDALARSESACLGLEDKRSGLEALSLKGSLVETRCGLRWTHPAAQERGSSETRRVTETSWLEMATGIRPVLHLSPQASTEGP